MAKQEKVLESLKKLGVEPLEGRCIVVQFAPRNLSDKVARFLIVDEPLYVLQICKKELLLAPLKWSGNLKNEEPLKIELSEIQSVEIGEKGFNYHILITCDDGEIDLLAQKKDLSAFTKSSAISVDNFWGTENWHGKNLDATLEELQTMTSR